MKNYRLLLFIALAIGSLFAINYYQKSQVKAACGAMFNRDCGTGYFTGAPIGAIGTSRYTWPGGQFGIIDINAFTARIHYDLFNTPYIPCGLVLACITGNADTQGVLTGTALIVDTMLGVPGTNFSTRIDGINYAQNHYNDWLDLVTAYNDRGWIIWNDRQTFSGSRADSLAFNYGTDAGFYDNNEPPAQEFYIHFHNASTGEDYFIKKKCGNVTGDARMSFPPPIPPPTVDIKIKGSNDAGFTSSPNAIDVNQNIMVGWTTTNADECHADGGTWGNSGNNIGANPNNSQDRSGDSATWGTKTYRISCSGLGGSTSPVSVSIIVNPPNPSVTLTVNGKNAPESIEKNDPITVAWFPVSASSCTASGNTGTWNGNRSNVSGSEDHTGDSGSAGKKTYTIICMGLDGVTPTPPYTVSITVASKPYLRVYGGDVLAGSGWAGDGCPKNSGIITYNSGTGGYAGAGVQFAAQAYGAITDFASAALRAPPNTLSFANTSGTYGGGFNSAVCAADYWGSAPAPSTSVSRNSVNINPSLTSGKARYKPTLGDTSLDVKGTGAGNDVSDSVNAVVYVDGDAYINRSISYTGSGSWGSISAIPSFYLVVKGDIYIDESVTNLDGVYIAQGGTIYTCAHKVSGTPTYYRANQLYSQCYNQLVINGAFIANQVRFLRTNGTLREASSDRSADGKIAEIFKYSPEIYLVDPGLFPSSGSNYDSMSSLPPVL